MIYLNELRKKRKEAGLCIHCTNKAIQGQTLCLSHKEEERQFRLKAKDRRDTCQHLQDFSWLFCPLCGFRFKFQKTKQLDSKSSYTMIEKPSQSSYTMIEPKSEREDSPKVENIDLGEGPTLVLDY